jgi:N-acetylmuramoyl-L-alanine amidase-like protein
MRKASSVLLLGLAVPALSALPVVTAPQAEARPVAPMVRNVPLGGVDPSTLRTRPGARSAAVASHAWQQSGAGVTAAPRRQGLAPTRRPAVLTKALRTRPFQLMGVTWRTGTKPVDLTVVVRAHTGKGWGEWTALDLLDVPPARDEAGRYGTEPLWVGTSDGYQVRVDLHSGRLPRGLRVDLVSPGSSPADSAGGNVPAASAGAAAAVPQINTRKAWGADERLRGSGPSYTSTIKAGFVHHTAGTNNYSAADVPKIIRGIYAYHTKSNGWSDIGYNFLVDKFGRVWEGRYGGVTKAVLGAHTGGFNVDTFAVSALGNYDKAPATAPMIDSIARVMAWKLSLNYRDPNGRTSLVSQGGGTSRYRAGARVAFNVISGHRDAGNTSCPGKNLYAQLPNLRALTAQYMGSGIVDPATSPIQPTYGGAPMAVTARTLGAQQWRLDVLGKYDGAVLRTMTGAADPATPVSTAWDLRDEAGNQARPGAYTLRMQSAGATDSARTWTHTVTVVPPRSTPPTAPAIGLPGRSGYVPLDPTRIYDTRTGGRLPLGPGQRVDIAVAGIGGVPAAGVGAVALTVTASRPSGSTYLSVWPAGGRKPTSSTLNLPAGSSRSALAVSALGGNGLVSLYNSTGTTELAVDVVGYYPVGAAGGQTLHPVAPFRLFDSRKDGGILAKGEGRTLTMPTLSGVTAARMGAAIVNVTAAGATGDGELIVHRPGSGLDDALSLTYSPGAAVANRAVTTLTDGQLRINNRGAATQVVVDVVGWYAPTSVAGGKSFQAMAPRRVLDTRTGTGARKARVGQRKTIAVAVSGKGRALPASASAVVLNLTSTGATARSTYLTAWPAGLRRPTVSDLNVASGRTTANLVVVRIGSSGKSKGKINLYNNSGSTHMVGDIVGYYR